MRNQIVYLDYTFTDVQISAGSLGLECSLPSSSIGIDTLEATVKCSDPSIIAFVQNTPMTYFYRGQQKGVFYLQSVTREGPDRYTLSGVSAMGLLSQMEHKGGLYSGETAGEIIRDICGPIPVAVKSCFENIALYGWLPYVKPTNSSARDNLSQVLFALGASLTTDLDGVLRVGPLWDGVTCAVPMDRIYRNNANVEYTGAVTEVSVTEHQYTPGTDEKTLFEGSTTQGDIITFDEPMHSLVATGFTILESGSNYAVVSSGSGTLTGKTYIHNTRQIVEPVSESAMANVKTVDDATLVSLVNSLSVARRLAAYYRCTATISCGIVAQSEQPGDVVKIYDPYDRKMVDACLATQAVTLSATLKAELTALVGFYPPQPEALEYFNERVVLTGSGQWTVPDGVTTVRYVLFSGAQGGQAGVAGGTASGSKTHTYTHTSWITGKVNTQGSVTLWGGPGGKGGAGGQGGKGSKVLEGNMSVTPGQVLSFACGVGGLGAAFNASSAALGAEGTATTFGGKSSDEGNYPATTGWVDPVTAEVFATSGLEGLPGGNGAGAPENYDIPSNSSDLNEILVFQPSTGAVDEDDVTWPGGPTQTVSGQSNVAYWQTYTTNPNYAVGAWAGYALGPGGAAGVNTPQPSTRGSNGYNNATAANGVQGSTPTLIPKKPALTFGGRGGYGGGGGSCASWAGAEKDPTDYSGSITTRAGQPGVGGNGGQGGPGGDGCIILFYSMPRPVEAGPVVEKNQRWVLDRMGRRMIV